MAGVMVVDIHCGCLSAVFRGGVDHGNFSGTLVEAYDADNMNGVMVVYTHFGFLCL